MSVAIELQPGHKTLAFALQSPERGAGNRSQSRFDWLSQLSKRVYAVFLDYLSVTFFPWSWKNSRKKSQEIKRGFLAFNAQRRYLQGWENLFVVGRFLREDEQLSPLLFEKLKEERPWLTTLFSCIARHETFIDTMIASFPPISWMQNYHKNQELTLLKSASLAVRKSVDRMIELVKERIKDRTPDEQKMVRQVLILGKRLFSPQEGR